MSLSWTAEHDTLTSQKQNGLWYKIEGSLWLWKAYECYYVPHLAKILDSEICEGHLDACLSMCEKYHRGFPAIPVTGDEDAE